MLSLFAKHNRRAKGGNARRRSRALRNAKGRSNPHRSAWFGREGAVMRWLFGAPETDHGFRHSTFGTFFGGVRDSMIRSARAVKTSLRKPAAAEARAIEVPTTPDARKPRPARAKPVQSIAPRNPGVRAQKAPNNNVTRLAPRRRAAANSDAQANASLAAGSEWGRRTREVIGLLLLGFSLLAAVALISAGDPTTNLAGPFGHALATRLFALFGVTAFLFVPAVALVALAALRVRVLRVTWLESAGFGALLFCCALLLQVVVPNHRFYAEPPGGALGVFIGTHLQAVVGAFGAALVAVVAGAASVVIACGFTFGAALEALLNAAIWLSAQLAKASWSALRWFGSLMRESARDIGDVVGNYQVERAERAELHREEEAAQRELKKVEARRKVEELHAQTQVMLAQLHEENAAAGETLAASELVSTRRVTLKLAAGAERLSSPGLDPDDLAPEAANDDGAALARELQARRKKGAPADAANLRVIDGGLSNPGLSNPGLPTPGSANAASAAIDAAPWASGDGTAARPPLVLYSSNPNVDLSALTVPGVAAAPAAPAAPAPTESLDNPQHSTSGVQIIDVAAQNAAREELHHPARREAVGPWKLPSTDLLEYHRNGTAEEQEADRAQIEMQIKLRAEKLRATLESYGVTGKVMEIRRGPVVTVYEYLPDAGVKSAKVTTLANDLALQLAVYSVRVVPNIPGKGVMGIEVPNDTRAVVSFREVCESRSFLESKSKLTLALGKDIEGAPFVQDLAKMPHLLVAGATGTGKSVAMNTMLMSVLFNATPDEVRLILIDPKHVEFQMYEDIPHLLLPVVTDPKQTSLALMWAVDEMERRYKLFASERVRNLAGYNKLLEKRVADDSWKMMRDADGNLLTEPPKAMPQIIIVIDELAELLMVAKEVETAIARLAQKARAAGLHLIIATQKPSTDVISGVIKANLPARLSCKVSAGYESKVILDCMGAEQLLGRGDMLVRTDTQGLVRVQGGFVSDEEVEAVVTYLKNQGTPEYDDRILMPRDDDDDGGGGGGAGGGDLDPMYHEAVQLVMAEQKVSISWIQRKLAIGYQRSARIVEQMEEMGVVTPADHKGKREVIFR